MGQYSWKCEFPVNV